MKLVINTPKQNKGFTLIEVLVALIILAIALMAIVKAVNTNVRNLSYVRDKITAQWVADNVLNTMQAGLLAAPHDQPQQGNTDMLNQHWYWQALPEQQKNQTIQRVNIVVTNKLDGKPLIHLIGFINVQK